jgi:hypothetical protein
MASNRLTIFDIAVAFVNATAKSNDEIANLISLSTTTLSTTTLTGGETIAVFSFDLTDQANLQTFQAKISANNILNQTATNTISAFGSATQTVASKIS